MTHIFHSLNVKESKKIYRASFPWTTTSKYEYKIEKIMIWILAIMLKFSCSVFFPLNYVIDINHSPNLQYSAICTSLKN